MHRRSEDGRGESRAEGAHPIQIWSFIYPSTPSNNCAYFLRYSMFKYFWTPFDKDHFILLKVDSYFKPFNTALY